MHKQDIRLLVWKLHKHCWKLSRINGIKEAANMDIIASNNLNSNHANFLMQPLLYDTNKLFGVDCSIADQTGHSGY